MEPDRNPENKDARPPANNPFKKLKGLAAKIPDPKKLVALFGKISNACKPFLTSVLGRLGLATRLEKWKAVLLSKIPDNVQKKLRPYGRWIALGFTALVLFFGVKNCFFGKAKPKVSLEQAVQQQQKEKESLVPVKGFRVGRFNFEDSLNALGTIKGAMEFKLSFEVPGTISSINYREGERYEEGALLISLRQDDILLRLKRAQAEYNKAQTQTKIAEEKVKDHEKLFAMGAIPKTTLDSVKLEAESSKFEGESARLEVKANESMLEKSNLYAPSAGMIGDLSVEEGETITPNTLLGTHIMTEFVYAEFGVVERDVNKIALGQKAKVFVDAYPDKTFEGVIENIAPVVAGTSRTATVRVRVENPDRLLLPGMFARIRILLYSKKNTLIVPTDSVQGKEGEQFVYVVHSKKEMAAPKSAKGASAKAAQGQAPSPQAAGMEGAPAGLPGQAQLGEALKNHGANIPGPAGKGAEKPKKGGPDVTPIKAKASKKKGEKGKTEKQEQAEEPDTVEKRAITVGYTRPDYSQIDAGLSEGEVVAVSGLERLEDGKKVRLLEVQEAET